MPSVTQAIQAVLLRLKAREVRFRGAEIILALLLPAKPLAFAALLDSEVFPLARFASGGMIFIATSNVGGPGARFQEEHMKRVKTVLSACVDVIATTSER
jgi:hypothetical protein